MSGAIICGQMSGGGKGLSRDASVWVLFYEDLVGVVTSGHVTKTAFTPLDPP